MSLSHDTIAAIATPAGRGGIGVVRVSGVLCKEIYQALTGIVPKPRIAEYVSFKSTSGEMLDKGIGIFFKGPASYTGEDVFECHAHANRIILDQLLEEIVLLGARLARPGEFTERAFLNNKMDLIQAEAVVDLIDSHSRKAARSAIQSLDGVFSTQVLNLREQVFKARALVEAALDFPEEEDVSVDLDPAINIIKQSREALKQVLNRAQAGRVLDQKPSVVIIGPPNVGKSSIINFLSGNDVAIVSTTPGTTRDIVKESVLLKDNVFSLIDTAGIRESDDHIEKEGMNRAYKELSQADLVLFVFDASQVNNVEPSFLCKRLSPETRSITVWNKEDLCQDKTHINSADEVYVSAKTGLGMDNLIEKICHKLNQLDSSEDLIFARQRHIDALSSVQKSLDDSLINLEKGVGMEVIAENLRQALSGFDQITGKTTTDDILGEVFSRFCIGK